MITFGIGVSGSQRNIYATLVWAGGTLFYAKDAYYDYQSPEYNLSSGESCIVEAGSFLATSPVLSLAQLTVPTWNYDVSYVGVNGTPGYSFDEHVVDRACGLVGVPCLNGVFPGGNQGQWNENLSP